MQAPRQAMRGLRTQLEPLEPRAARQGKGRIPHFAQLRFIPAALSLLDADMYESCAAKVAREALYDHVVKGMDIGGLQGCNWHSVARTIPALSRLLGAGLQRVVTFDICHL